MKLQLNIAILTMLIIALSVSCEKDISLGSNQKIELYLLESYSTLPQSNQIDESSMVIQSAPLLHYSDFQWYDPAEYTFALSEQGRGAIGDLELSANGVPFAVMANDTSLIYTGYFWPGISSGVCDCIVMDPMDLYEGNKIQVRLGYPYSPIDIPDRRNDKWLIRIFKQDHKLK